MPKGVPKYGSKYFNKFTIGQKIGMWTVIDNSIIQLNSQGGASIKVKCECGTESMVSCHRLLNGQSYGCSCRIRGDKSFYWTGVGDIPGKYISQLKNSAKKRNIEYSISNEYLWNLFLNQNAVCKLSKLPLVFGNRTTEQTASLDRIDSSIGYVTGNIQWVHKKINMMKNELSQSEFLKLCEVISDYNRIGK